MDMHFWEIAERRMRQRLADSGECLLEMNEQSICPALTILLEENFLTFLAKEFLAPELWKVLFIRILGHVTENATDKNVLDLFEYLSTMKDENTWWILCLHFGAVDGHCYSAKKIGKIFAIDSDLALGIINTELNMIRQAINPAKVKKEDC
jgi:hypothetical protein